MAARATALLASGQRLLLTDLILAECVYVLESFYEVKPPRVAAAHALGTSAAIIETVNAALLLRALEVYETDRLDFAEAYLVALTEASGVGAIASLTGRSTKSRASAVASSDACFGPETTRSGSPARVAPAATMQEPAVSSTESRCGSAVCSQGACTRTDACPNSALSASADEGAEIPVQQKSRSPPAMVMGLRSDCAPRLNEQSGDRRGGCCSITDGAIRHPGDGPPLSSTGGRC